MLLVLFVLNTVLLNAQQIDYNAKKGFVANGYDVVSYFDDNAVEGNKKFTSQFDGASYKFSTQENLTIFKANPTKYIPQYGGYCAYAISFCYFYCYLFRNYWWNGSLRLWWLYNT